MEKNEHKTDKDKNVISGVKLAKLLGVSYPAVKKAVKAGRIKYLPGTKRYDKDQAIRDWNVNRKTVARVHTEQPTRGPDQGRPPGDAPPADSDGDSLIEVNIQKSYWEKEKKRLEVEEMRGRLLNRDKVHKESFNTARQIRDAMLNIPGRVMEKVAAESDPYKCENILKEQINEALEGLANDLQRNQNSS